MISSGLIKINKNIYYLKESYCHTSFAVYYGMFCNNYTSFNDCHLNATLFLNKPLFHITCFYSIFV